MEFQIYYNLIVFAQVNINKGSYRQANSFNNAYIFRIVIKLCFQQRKISYKINFNRFQKTNAEQK